MQATRGESTVNACARVDYCSVCRPRAVARRKKEQEVEGACRTNRRHAICPADAQRHVGAELRGTYMPSMRPIWVTY